LWILQERLSADPGFQDAEGNLVGAELVRKCVSHLGVSRHGLSHAELAGTVDPGDARGNVAALERLLRPYLMRRGELLDFYHGQLREAVEAEYLDEEHERVEAHRSLAGHFRDRTDPTKDSSWAGDDPRGFSELCYHQTQGQMWSQLEATLCDLKFVEVRCLKRMLFDVLRDCDEATRAHDLPAVTQLRNALWLEVDGLIGRPELATQSLYNRLIWFDRSGPVQRAELDKARSRLEEKRCWLSAEAPLPEGQAQGTSSIPFQITSTVQSVCLATQSVAIAAPDGDLEVRDLNYGRLIERRRLTALRIATIVLCEDNSLAAYMDVDGTVRSEDGLASVPGRKGEKRLAYASTVGVLAVREDGALIAWHPQHAGTRVLRSRIPAPLVALQIAPDEQSVLFVAGFRSQVVGLCTRDGEVWSTAIVPYDGPPAMDAKADWAAGRLLLACQDRCLRIIDTASGTESAHLAYERRKDALLRGVPAKCDWGSGRSRGLAFLATRQGHLAAWDWKNDVLEPLDEYCTASDLAMLCLFEVLPQSGRLVLTFPDRALVVSREGRRHSRRHHSAAVTDCALTEAGKVASISEGDRTIRWNKVRGLEQEAVHATYNLTPTAVALTHRPGAVLIGTREGQVWQQEPGITTPLHEIDQIFAERIVSLFATSDSEASIAARSGSVRWKDFASGREEVLWHARRGQHQRKIIPAGSWGRYWSFYDDADRGSTVLSLVTGTDRETVVFDSHRGLADVAVSPDGSLLCLAGDGVEVWRHSGGRWSCAWRRPGFACHIAFAEGGNLLAVAAREPWLEIWQVAEDLPTLAAQRIPGRITCLAAVGEVIAIGLSTGELISLRLHQSG